MTNKTPFMSIVMFAAVKKGDFAEVERLLDAGADVGAREDGDGIMRTEDRERRTDESNLRIDATGMEERKLFERHLDIIEIDLAGATPISQHELDADGLGGNAILFRLSLP